MYIYICIYTYIYIYVYIYVYIYMYIYMCTYICIYMCILIMNVYIFINTRRHCMSVYVCLPGTLPTTISVTLPDTLPATLRATLPVTRTYARNASASRHQRDVHIGVTGLANALVDAIGLAIHMPAQEAPHILGRDHARCLVSVCVVGFVGI